MTEPTHRQRLENCLAGKPLDRIPTALWRHFPVDDQTPDGLAAAVADFQKSYDFDLIKVTPSSSYCLKDWGCQDVWRGNPEGTREYTHHPIQSPEDWVKLPVLDPHKGSWGEQIESLRLLRKEFSPHTPVLPTIFSPLAQAKNLAGGKKLLAHLRQYPDALRAGLETITQTTIAYVRLMVDMGVDGVFYALQHCQYSLLSESEFTQFSKQYDMRILAEAKICWLNMLHLHGEDVMFDVVLDYPAKIINWHDRETLPTLQQAQAKYGGMVCGGVRQWETLAYGTPEAVKREARNALEQTCGKRIILGTGCVTPVLAPRSNILALKQAANEGLR